MDDVFLPGVGDWKSVWLLRDLWHFHFHGSRAVWSRTTSRPQATDPRGAIRASSQADDHRRDQEHAGRKRRCRMAGQPELPAVRSRAI